MEKAYAVVDGAGLVVNVVLWDGNLSTWQPDEGCKVIAVPEDFSVAPGCIYIDGEFYKPSEQGN